MVQLYRLKIILYNFWLIIMTIFLPFIKRVKPISSVTTLTFIVFETVEFFHLFSKMILWKHMLHQAYRVNIRVLFLQNQTTKNQKKLCGNTIPDKICFKIHEQVKRYEVKDIHYGRQHRKYFETQLDLLIMHRMFESDYPDLEDKVKYNMYNTYFKEHLIMSK